jgi:hypothetical protein
MKKELYRKWKELDKVHSDMTRPVSVRKRAAKAKNAITRMLRA